MAKIFDRMKDLMFGEYEDDDDYYEDDYDTDGYKNILEHLKSEGVEVYGKGSHGHHNDNHESVVGWFLSQYRLILEEDFNRK